MLSTLPVDATAPPEAKLRVPDLHDRLRSSRQLSLTLAAPLSDEDQTVQPMDDASPTKWHLAHTTWFYESFILKPNLPDYRQFSADFEYCFNSYYESKGERQPRGRRGLLTRPSAAQVREYRAHVDEALARLFSQGFVAEGPDAARRADRARHQSRAAASGAVADRHPQSVRRQSAAPRLSPAAAESPSPSRRLAEAEFVAFDGGIRAIGYDGAGFSYDNEGPRHEVLLYPYRLANRCVTNGDWLAFIEAGGYREPLLWLADGWATVQGAGLECAGLLGRARRRLAADDARRFAARRSARARHAHQLLRGKCLRPLGGQAASHRVRMGGGERRLCARRQRSHAPMPCVRVRRRQPSDGRLAQMFGDVWEWTSSAYLPYPGYRPAPGAVGEYNGKFMVSQNVLRGGSCATPPGHIRATYRNFFFPHQRWQFTGLRLAEDAA